MKKKTARLMAAFLALTLAFAAFPAVSAAGYTTSDWAKPELQDAADKGLIPDSLQNADLTKPITRAEFAAVSVKTYENLTGEMAEPIAVNPFKDTKDPEVLKAYNLGITAGTSATTFEPGAVLDREQMATMLTRVLKAALIPGWTLETDGDYPLDFDQGQPFTDDAKIDGWAKPSVYFMAANGIVKGNDGNIFAPQDKTLREQAVAVAVRMVNYMEELYSFTTESKPVPAPIVPGNGLTLDKVRETAESLGYTCYDGYGINGGSGAKEPVAGNEVYYEDGTGGSIACISFVEFPSAADAQTYAAYINGMIVAYPDTYKTIRCFSADRFYIQIEDISSPEGKDVLTALLPGWDKLVK